MLEVRPCNPFRLPIVGGYIRIPPVVPLEVGRPGDEVIHHRYRLPQSSMRDQLSPTLPSEMEWSEPLPWVVVVDEVSRRHEGGARVGAGGRV